MKAKANSLGIDFWSLTSPSKLLTGMMMMTCGLGFAVVKVLA